MKQALQNLLRDALGALIAAGELAPVEIPEILIEPPRNLAHGDFSTNLALLLAKPCRKAPLAIAELVLNRLAAPAFLLKAEAVAPGFINFFVRPAALLDVLGDILTLGTRYGRSVQGAGQKLQLEFVSANPTGPLHVGHGRGAAYGAVLASLLRAQGYDVVTEYYVNDAGRQMDILALSVWLRYLQLRGRTCELPGNAYQGAYVADIAAGLAAEFGRRFEAGGDPCLPSAGDYADGEALLDACIAHCRARLGAVDYAVLHRYGCEAILAGINTDLRAFGVEFDSWYSERSLAEGGKLETALGRLRARGHLYVKDGAEWFRSSAFGDEKDRVVVRENGAATYFASDIAYHADKFARGFARVINIWGADHHGYIPRVHAALAALGIEPARLEVLLVQFATLYRGGEKVQMSTRSGEFVTLQELVAEVGVDAARFFYITRRSDQHLDFDLDLAKSQSQDNPVYYLQYAHARICSVFRQLEQQAAVYDRASGLAARDRLAEKQEHALAASLARYPEILADAASKREPHLLASYLRELATEFHAYYNTHKIIVADPVLRQARLALVEGVKSVLADGLDLLGVSAPTEM